MTLLSRLKAAFDNFFFPAYSPSNASRLHRYLAPVLRASQRLSQRIGYVLLVPDPPLGEGQTDAATPAQQPTNDASTSTAIDNSPQSPNYVSENGHLILPPTQANRPPVRIKRPMKQPKIYLFPQPHLHWLRDACFAIVAIGASALLAYLSGNACTALAVDPNEANQFGSSRVRRSVPVIPAVARLYYRFNNECGLYGLDCPAETGKVTTHRCDSRTVGKVMSRVYVGAEKVLYKPYIVGGKDKIFRGDSWICASAIESRVISSVMGGCVEVTERGAKPQFPIANAPAAFGLGAVAYDSWFPVSYSVSECDSPSLCSYSDIGMAIIILCATATALVLFRPSNRCLHFVLAMVGSVTIAFVTNAYVFNNDAALSLFARLLPALFTFCVFYFVCGKHLVPPSETHSVDLAIFGVVPFVCGCMSNVFEALVPVSSFSGTLELTPALIVAMVVIGSFLLILAILLLVLQRRQHRLHIYLVGILIVGGAIGGISLFSKFPLHVHHYQVPLIFIPLLQRLQRRVFLIAYFALAGVFLNGAIRWGMAPAFDKPLEAARLKFVPGNTFSLAELTSTNYSFVPAPTDASAPSGSPPKYLLRFSDAYAAERDVALAINDITVARTDVQFSIPESRNLSIHVRPDIDLLDVLKNTLQLPKSFVQGRPLYASLAPLSGGNFGDFSPGVDISTAENYENWINSWVE